MQNSLFLLIDSLDHDFYLRYEYKLNNIHKNLLKKLVDYDVIVVGHKESRLTDNKFDNLKSLYKFVAKHSQNKDIIVCDAFAGLLSLKDTEKVLNYMRQNLYDVCLTENLPDGLVPMTVSYDFIEDLSSFIEEDKEIESSLKNIINWEYKGIDIGVYLSPSLLIMERIDFLPIHKGAIDYIQELLTTDVSMDTIDKILVDHPNMLRHYPQYIAIELTSHTDGFYSKEYSSQEMSLDLFRKIITEIDEYAPEALISLGIWGDPFTHHKFTELFSLLSTLPNKILVESRSLVLSQESVHLVLSRPNTELIFDISFTTESMFKQHKKNPYHLAQITDFIKSLAHKKNIWVRLTRTPETEESIPYFLKEWKEFMPNILITKGDSFGSQEHKVVDLAPINRHACYALRRELTILNDGRVLLCRQSDKEIGSLNSHSLAYIWEKNNSFYRDHLQKKYDICSQCQFCDDWWIWN